MKKRICLLLMLLAAGYAEAQQYDCNCELPEDPYEDFMKDQLLSVQYQNPIYWYRGEQYFNEWTSGEVRLSNGAVIRDITLRYDMFADELLWLRQMDNRTAIVTKAVVGEFTLFDARGGNTGTFEKKSIGILGLGKVDSYLQLLVDGGGMTDVLSVGSGDPGDNGTVSLYAYRNVVRVMNESRLRDNTLYFIEAGEGLSPVFPRRKSLLNVNGIDRDKMKALMRTNHIRLRNREGYLVEAVLIYNSER